MSEPVQGHALENLIALVEAGNSDAMPWGTLHRALVDYGKLQDEWRGQVGEIAEMQQRIAALETRAERLRSGLNECNRLANAIGELSWEAVRDVVDAALAAEPDTRPLYTVRQALVNINSVAHITQLTAIESDAAAALRALAEMGIA